MPQLETTWEFRLHSQAEPIDMGFIRSGYVHNGWGLIQLPKGSITEGPWIEQQGSAPWVGLYRLETVVPAQLSERGSCLLEVLGAGNLNAWADGRPLPATATPGVFHVESIPGNRHILLCLALNDHPGSHTPLISINLF